MIELKQRFDYLEKEIQQCSKLEYNWNTYGASPIPKIRIDITRKIISKLQEFLSTTVEEINDTINIIVGPSNDSLMCIEIEYNDNCLCFSILDEKEIEVSVSSPNGEVEFITDFHALFPINFSIIDSRPDISILFHQFMFNFDKTWNK